MCGPREAIRTAEIRLAEVGTFRMGQKAHAAGIEPVMDFSWWFRGKVPDGFPVLPTPKPFDLDQCRLLPNTVV